MAWEKGQRGGDHPQHLETETQRPGCMARWVSARRSDSCKPKTEMARACSSHINGAGKHMRWQSSFVLRKTRRHRSLLLIASWPCHLQHMTETLLRQNGIGARFVPCSRSLSLPLFKGCEMVPSHKGTCSRSVISNCPTHVLS